jgi:hypothetical protein
VTELHRPRLGEPNAPCRTCGSPLAEDQRYCLQCGARRAEARLPFLEILAAPRERAAAPPPPSRLRRFSANTVAVAGVACLLLALGVGVLIGDAGDSTASNGSATPQVISVGGVAPAAATTTTATTAGTSAAGDPSSSSSSSAKSSKPKTKASSSSPAKTKATNKALKNLDSTSGADYQKKASKLPKQVGTGGKAPPKDKKPAAGGGSFTEIG